MFSEAERIEMVFQLFQLLSYEDVCRIGLGLESKGFYDDNARLQSIRELTELAQGQLSDCRRPKADYMVPFQKAIQKVLAEETSLEIQAAQETAARKKVIQMAFTASDTNALALFYSGLLVGKVMSRLIPQTLTPWFKPVSDGLSDAEPEYKTLILEVLSQKISLS